MSSFIADAVLVLHAAFVLFVVLGGLLVLRWPRVAWLHVPAAVWGVAVEFAGWYCPLTPLENRFRELAGDAMYEGDFVARYLLPVIYPDGLTRRSQIVLGLFVLVLNVSVYTVALRRGRPKGAPAAPPDRDSP